MTPRRAAVALASLLVLVAVGAVALGLVPRGPRQPNVLVIVWDTVRADRLTVYGHTRETTPRLQELAQTALVFERSISNGMWTPPSHASMFTGFAGSHHGMKASYKWLDEHHVTLAEHLRDHGWDTFVFSANPYVAPSTNLTQGFDTITASFSAPYKKLARRSTLRKLVRRDASTDISPGWEGPRTVGDVHPYKDATPVAHKALLEWITGREDTRRPWFAFLNLMEAHIPRVPSMASRRALLTKEQIDLGLKTPVSQIDLLAYTFGKKEYTPAELDAINGVYDAALRDLDAATGRIFDDLAERGLLDDTIVVLTSDHGENLGDHHMFGHKFGLHDTLLHVPLVIWAPGRITPGRVSTPVSNLSLFATVLDAVGLAPPPPGPDLTSSLLGPIQPSALFSELIESTPVSVKRVDKEFGLFDKSLWLRTFRGVEEDGWKLVEASDGSHELFHVAEDRGELTNLAGQEPERAAALSRTLSAWHAALPRYDRKRRGEADKPEKLDRATLRMLEKLGYLEGEEDDEVPAGPETDEPIEPEE